MKKFIATILSAIVGLFGYTIVDTATDARLSELESRVAHLESVVEEYHGENYIPEVTIPNTTVVPTTSPVEATTAPSDGRYLVDSGYCGDYATWALYSDGELIIAGEGAMYESTPGWKKYEYQIEKVVIEDGITSICAYAFERCQGITSVIIGNGVTSIGDSSFSVCTGLRNLKIGNSVKSIGESAFSSCTSLGNVTIPDSVTNIGWNAFGGCSNLVEITIGNNVTTIGDQAFSQCEKLTYIIIPDSVISIGYNAFRDCPNLISITIGKGVTSIGANAFNNSKHTDVYYAGTEEQWNAIEFIGTNQALENATIHYNYTV